MDEARDGTYRAGTGEALVLLHIGRRPWLKWETCLPALTQRFDVFVPTYPGCEGGEPLTGPASIHTLVDGVERAMDAARITKAHCVGNSIGGWIAFELARRGRAHSDRPAAATSAERPLHPPPAAARRHAARGHMVMFDDPDLTVATIMEVTGTPRT